ncbi:MULTISPECIES: class I SAM-dependent methyltransferase [Leptospira]|uniref:Class I SAM-dependent methyltransferase n=1 Tax=Leptospira interrogans serovar Bataviae TaxID=312175 RepID=A0AAQ0B2F0_LEPIR|nr:MULTISPECIES: class I SAM-dependent methyltransferase [Leptospira]EMN71110.1 methyltransferase domain protein [Leptospira interrogans serovar Bataviae str. UI 08561]EKP04882.1 methyltransferase domain protein [Leptospira kirschneri str. 2008720114]EKR24614.1 methyltransferase domain protein [Leptospira interrogans serovar Bataviae str. L1111]MCR8647624.1 methyltransferase [Leptospira interrogans serovar Bataviae]OAM73282.1 methyltransferase [Leptospira interrogans serovar Bataviae]
MLLENESNTCPACLSRDIQLSYFISTEGFLSIAGFNHSKCNQCRTIFLNPLPTKDSLNAFYKSTKMEEAVEAEIAKNSAERILNKEKKVYFVNNRILPLQKFIKPEAKIFDVGCGVGSFIRAMNDSGYSVRGCDLSNVSINVGKSLLGLNDYDIFYGDYNSIPEEDYDMITLWTVIEHLLYPEEALSFIRKKLNSGYLLLEFPCADSLMMDLYGKHYFWIMPPYHINLFSQEGLRCLLERAGFEIVYTHGMPANWNFFETIAKFTSMPKELIDAIKFQCPEFVFEIDKNMDLLASALKKESVQYVICKTKS